MNLTLKVGTESAAWRRPRVGRNAADLASDRRDHSDASAARRPQCVGRCVGRNAADSVPTLRVRDTKYKCRSEYCKFKDKGNKRSQRHARNARNSVLRRGVTIILIKIIVLNCFCCQYFRKPTCLSAAFTRIFVVDTSYCL